MILAQYLRFIKDAFSLYLQRKAISWICPPQKDLIYQHKI